MGKIQNKLRNLTQIFILIVLTLMLSAFVHADLSVPTQINLGGSSQERGVISSTTFTITNTNTTESLDITGTSFQSAIAGYANADFNITLTGVPATIAQNTSAIVTLQGYVPLRFTSGNQFIGNLVITNENANTNTIPVYLEAITKLEVNQVEIEVNDDSERVSDGETIDVKRGDTITLTINIENEFSSATDIDINDVTVIVENDNLDVDEEDDLGDLGPRDDNDAVINFDIANDADDGKESIIITVDGVDDNNAVHQATFRFYLDVQVERYDLTINELSANPTSACPGSTVTITTDIENTGLRDLDDAMIYLTAEDLNFNKKITGILIDEGDSKTLTTTFIVPSTTPEGTYLLEAESFFEPATSAKRDDGVATLVVRNCQATTTTGTTTNQSTTSSGQSGFQVVTPAQTTTGAVFATPVTKKSTSLFNGENTLLIVLVITNVLVLILLLVFLTSTRRYY